jgi:hypothetical protein
MRTEKMTSPTNIIEITKLPSCTKKVNLNYNNIPNNIYNNGISVTYNLSNLNNNINNINNAKANIITEDFNNTISLEEITYKLSDIKFMKSNFSYNNVLIDLNLKIYHIDLIHTSKNPLQIIIPLQFNDNNSSNSILNNTDIPEYECCTPKHGFISNSIMCDIRKHIANNSNFYIIKDTNYNNIFITLPLTFDKELGNKILNTIEYDKNENYIIN